MASASTLYDEVVSITAEYLGPAADRFVVRQIRNHLQKNPTELKHKDLTRLIDWIQLAMRLISDDRAVVDNYIADLEQLAMHKTANLHQRGEETAS